MPDGMQTGRSGCVSDSPASPRAAPIGSANRDAAASSAAHWVCVHHRAGLGSQVKFALRSEGIEVHWPREEIPQGRKKDPIIRPLFAGYLFAQAKGDRGWSKISRTNNVLGILGVKTFGRPTVIPDRIVEKLVEEAGSIDGVVNNTPEALAARAALAVKTLTPGPVRFEGGSFDALTGFLAADDGKAFVEVLTELFGAPRVVRVPREQVVGA